MALTNSGRHLLKATYAPIEFEQPPDKLSQAHVKAALVRGLQLQPGEVDAVRSKTTATGTTPIPDAVWSVLQQFEPQPVAALAPKASTLADVPAEHLAIFAQAALEIRTDQLRNLDQSAPPQPSTPPDPAGGSPSPPPSQPPAPPDPAGGPPSPRIGTRRLARGRRELPTEHQTTQLAPSVVSGTNVITRPSEMAIATAPTSTLAAASLAQRAVALSLVTFAKGALDTFTKAIKVSPIGILHLERIEMEPAGIERGELVATIPLAPGETTSVTQKEWSVMSQDFSSIVTDFLENYSEKGVTEKSELAESTESQTKHSEQLGLSASLSGSYGFVTFATSATANISDSTDEGRKQSRNQAKEVTSKASSRSRKEHKVTIQTSSTTGKEETSTRTLTNPSTSNTMRIDYFSMMRKWRVRLLQYGLRLTYDLAIPEPGGTLRKLHAQLAELDANLSTPFQFGVKPSDITRESYLNYANAYGASVPTPPDPQQYQLIGGQVQNYSKDDAMNYVWHFVELPVSVPEGYQISNVWVDAWLGVPDPNDPDRIRARGFVVFGVGAPWDSDGKLHQAWQDNKNVWHWNPSFVYDLTGYPDFLAGRSGQQKILYWLTGTGGAVTFRLTFKPSAGAMAQWEFAVWQAIYNAARDAYYTSLQSLTQKRDALKAQLENVDTLTLRREEREEIMKGMLRWLLGPGFDFMPTDVRWLFSGPVGQSFTGNELGLNPDGWTTMFIYQEMVKFIQQAIEWENMLYFVYPYFWDVPKAWDFARTLEHPDPTREAFLRAGSARVVLTIRSGYEEAFASFVERGELGHILPQDHPYLTIGQEIRAYDQTNYPGIPPANPDPQPRPLLTSLQKKAWEDMQGVMSLLESYKTKNARYPTTSEGLATLAGLGTGPSADPWGNAYQYQSPGKYSDYDLTSLGANGTPGGDGENADITSWADSSLIAEWYEYTPTHGLDIAITTALADMQ
jgi:hypothetical protein